MNASRYQPLGFELVNEQDIRIAWADGHVSTYPARYLRLQCGCAACVEELTGRPLLDPDKVPEDIVPVEVEGVGRYAVRIRWSDGHETGLYPLERLRSLCPCPACGRGGAGSGR